MAVSPSCTVWRLKTFVELSSTLCEISLRVDHLDSPKEPSNHLELRRNTFLYTSTTSPAPIMADSVKVDDAAPPPAVAAPASTSATLDMDNESDADKETSVLRLSAFLFAFKLVQVLTRLRRTVQFYLGDSNLPFDKFLFNLSQNTLTEGEKLKAPGTGWVAIAKLASFKRMAPYADFSPSQIGGILRERAGPLLAVDEAGERVRRSVPISIERSSGQVDRSIYAKGFPLDEQNGKLQERIEHFFNRHHQTNAVRMRREGPPPGTAPKGMGKGAFKGSVFTEFASKDDAKAFIALDPKPTFPGQSEPLEVLPKREYLDKKAEEHSAKADHSDHFGGKRFNAFTELKYAAKNGPRTRTIEYRGQDIDVENGQLAKPEQIEMKEGDADYIVRFSGVTNIDFQQIKVRLFTHHHYCVRSECRPQDDLGKVAEVAFVELPPRDPAQGADGFVSFRSPLTDAEFEAIKALDITDKEGKKYTFHRGDKEGAKVFHTRRAAFHARRSDFVDSRNDRGGGRGGGRGGRGSSRGGRGGDRGGRGGRGGDRDRRDGGGRDREDRREREDRKEKERAPTAESKADAPATVSNGADAAPTVAKSGELGDQVKAAKRKAEDGDSTAAAKKTKGEVNGSTGENKRKADEDAAGAGAAKKAKAEEV